MDELEEVLGNNSLEDLSWLCSLSEAELDMLISLKMMVLQRVKVIGCYELSEKFDLKILRALGLIVMEYLKENVKDKSLVPGLANSASFLDACNLLKCEVKDTLSHDEIKAHIGIDSRKRKRHPKCRAQNKAAHENQGTVSILLLKGIEQNDSKDCSSTEKGTSPATKFTAAAPNWRK